MIIQHFLRWKDSADVAQRVNAASALGRAYLYSELSFEDRCAAEASLTLLLDDPSEKVRYALAEALASSLEAPAHIISALVQDQYTIASLVIARSPIVHDRDLISYIPKAEDRLQVAIANRPQVSNRLAQTIAHYGCPSACVALLKNFNARVCGDCRKLIVNRHVENADVRGALLKDTDLEAELRLAVLKAASAALSSSPIFGKMLENGAANMIVRDAEQRALIHLATRVNGENADRLIEIMRSGGDLTTQMLVRAACHGKMDFLSRVIASLSGQSIERVTAILVNERQTQLRALLSSAGFGQTVIPVFEAAIGYWRDVAQGHLVAGVQEVTRMVMERFETGAKAPHEAANDDILSLLRSIHLDAMRDNARRHAISISKAA